jgi:hypothetical protein
VFWKRTESVAEQLLASEDGLFFVTFIVSNCNDSIQFILLSVDPLQGQRPHGYGNSQNILNLYNAQLFTVTYRRVGIGILVHISLTCYGFKLTQANYNKCV